MREARLPNSRRPFATRFDDWIHRRREHQAVKHGKIPGVIPYIGYGSTEWVRVLGRVLYLPARRAATSLNVKAQTGGTGRVTDHRSSESMIPPLAAHTARVRGWRSFTSVHVPHYPVQVLIDGNEITEVRSDRGGVIDHVIAVQLTPGWHTITLRVIAEDQRDRAAAAPHTASSAQHDTAVGFETHAPVYAVDPAARFGVISDVDDTILNTALPKPLVAAWNSFVLDEHARTSTPGMPVLYNHLHATYPGSPMIYLSTGAWNVAPALSRFLERNLYPFGPLLLTDWGPTAERWFRSGTEHKLRELARLVREFPDIRWLLIGDDGQHDEQLYQQFTSEHPDNVIAVVIRQLSVGQAVLAGGRSKASLHRSVSGVPWVYGPDGATIRQELMRLELL